MGSLMAGWDSPTSSSPRGVVERNKSLTNEEIDTFWKIKRKAQEEHLKAVAQAQAQAQAQVHVHATSDIQRPTNKNIMVSEANLKAGHRKLTANPPVVLDTSRSFPGCNTTAVAAESCQFAKDDLHNLKSAKAWWTRSSWAFLNEPPLMAMEDPTHKYAPQHPLSARDCKHGP